MSIVVNRSDLAEIQGKLDRIGSFGPRIVVQEINDTAKQIETLTVRAVRDELPGLRAASVRRPIRIIKATRSNLEAAVVVTHRPLNLERFGAREVGKKGGGVTVRIKGGREFIPKAFIISAKYGTGDGEGVTQIVVWRPKQGGKRVARKPLKGLYSTTPHDVAKDHRDRIVAQEEGRLVRNLLGRLNSELAGRGR